MITGMINGRLTGMVIMLLGLACMGMAPLALAADADSQTLDFQAIASPLDPGGELFLVVSARRWLDRSLATLASGKRGLPAGEAVEQETRQAIEQLRGVLARQGLSAWRGLGVSSVAHPDGRYATKVFLLRDAADANLPLWRGCFGWLPRHLLSLDFVPAGFSVVRAGTFDPVALWKMLGDGVREAGTPAARQAFEQFSQSAQALLGIQIPDLLGSLRDEYLVALRFDETKEWALPGGGGVAIPVPSFLVVIGTGEEVLRGVVEMQLSRLGLVLSETQVAGVAMRSTETTIMPGTLPIQPSFASPSGFFIFGSSPQIVEQALLASRHRHGLVTKGEFLNAFQGASMVNNGILYVDDKAAQIMRHGLASLQELTPGGDCESLAAGRVQDAWRVLGGESPACALVVQNWKNGVMIMGRSGVGGEAVLKQMALSALHWWTQLWHQTMSAERM